MSSLEIRGKVRLLTIFYIAALTLVGVLATITFLIVDKRLKAREQDGATINIAARQTMLAERLVRTGIALALDHDPEKVRMNTAMMETTISDLEASQQRLLSSDMNSPEISATLARTESSYQQMVQSAKIILANIKADPVRLPAMGDGELELLRESRPTYISGMERIVGLYETYARERIMGLQKTEFICVSLLVLTLLLEGVFIFRPLTRAVYRSFNELFTARTEVEQKNQQLDFALLEAQTAAKAREIFLATMSHEIRTPMNGVIGMTSLLLDTPLNADQRDLVHTIRVSGDALLHVINDILDFTKIQSGKMELEEIPFDITQSIEDALDILAPLALAKHLDLSYSLEDNMPQHLIGDPYRLRQILINLVGNALKFTAEGEVAVECSLMQREGSENQPGAQAWIRIAVRDTGIGIPEAGMGRLFESFTQVDATTTRKHGGTGLGLAISKRLAELMGGDIEVSSGVGEGSIFKLQLPLQVAEIQTERSLESFLRVIRGRLILIVDDNATNLKIFDRLCQKWGARTKAFLNPHEALDWLQETRPDLLLTDMFMPEMDGLSLCQQVRELEKKLYPAQPKVPIVLASSGGYHSEDPRCAEVELSARLTKPTRIRSLLQAISEALNQPESGQPAPAASKGAPNTEFAFRHPRKLLLVEDNKLNQKVAMRLLASLGYEADLAQDGYEAIEACRTHAYDLVFMDIQMPNLDGLSATRMIQQEMGEHAPYIVAMTANAMEDARNEVTEAGMRDYIAKPIRIDDLKRVLSAGPLPHPEAPDSPVVADQA